MPENSVSVLYEIIYFQILNLKSKPFIIRKTRNMSQGTSCKRDSYLGRIHNLFLKFSRR